MKTIISLLPVGDLRCASCQCAYWDADPAEEPPQGPGIDCFDPACPCHAVYWMTVPENVKRRLWGDR